MLRLMLPSHTPAPEKFFAPPNSLIHCNPVNSCGIELYVEFTNEVENSYGVVRSKMSLRQDWEGRARKGIGPVKVLPIRGMDSKPSVRGSLCMPTEELQMDEER